MNAQPMPEVSKAVKSLGSLPKTQTPQVAPQAAPQPSQAPETPQPVSSSETAPEPSPAVSTDPMGDLGGETVKDAPPEIFE